MRRLLVKVARAILPRDHVVYLVWDTSGMGRPVGVFQDLETAQRARLVNPNYYRLHACQLDAVAPHLAGWATARQLEELKTIERHGV